MTSGMFSSPIMGDRATAVVTSSAAHEGPLQYLRHVELHD